MSRNLLRSLRTQTTELFVLACLAFVLVLFLYRENIPRAHNIILSYLPNRSPVDIFNTPLSPTDPAVIKYLHEHHLVPPPPKEEPYQIAATVDGLSSRAMAYVDILEASTKV